MSFSKKVQVLIVGSGLAALACFPSQAATVRFTPSGSQLDTDSILDILVNPGQSITLSNYFNNSADLIPVIPGVNLPNPTRFIDYVVTYDPTELTYVSSVLDVNNKISNSCIAILNGGPCGSTITTGTGTLTINHKTSIANLVAPQAEFLLDTITFTATKGQPYPGDGLSDYSFIGTNRGLTAATISSFSSNTAEVQTPAPLPILGAGAAFGSIRRMRKFASLLRMPNTV